MRKTVGRALSFDAATSKAALRRVLSMDKSKKDKSSSNENENKIYASDDATPGEVWDQLRHIKTTSGGSVEVEGLLSSTVHQDMIPLIQAMTVGKQFEMFLFSDTFELGKFAHWSKMRDDMMDAAQQNATKSGTPSVVAWQATVKVSKGSDLASLEDFLETLQGDLSCSNVSFGGTSLESVACPSDIPDRICSLVDRETLKLKKGLSVIVVSGGVGNDKWCKLLEACTSKCVRLLKRGKLARVPRRSRSGDESKIKGLRRTKSHDSSSSKDEPKALRRSETLDTTKSSSDEKSSNTSITSMTSDSSASSSSAQSKSDSPPVVAKPTMIDDASDSTGRSMGSRSSTVRSMLADNGSGGKEAEATEKKELTWKQFGDMHKAKLALRRSQSLGLPVQRSMPTPNAA